MQDAPKNLQLLSIDDFLQVSHYHSDQFDFFDFHRVLCHHTKLQPFLDFWLVPEGPLVPGLYMDPKWTEFTIGMLFGADPPEILALVSPGVSQGTKIFGSKFFLYHPQKMLFYAFWGFVLLKMLKKGERGHFHHISPLQSRTVKLGCSSHFWAFQA